jgi:flagellar motor switch protein FliM
MDINLEPVTDEVVFEEPSELPSEMHSEGAQNAVLQDIPISISVELSQMKLSLKALVALQNGDVLELNKRPQELVDLVVAGRVIAKGELVDIDGEIGVRISSLVT